MGDKDKYKDYSKEVSTRVIKVYLVKAEIEQIGNILRIAGIKHELGIDRITFTGNDSHNGKAFNLIRAAVALANIAYEEGSAGF